MKQIFVSLVYEDKQHREKLEAWAREGRLGAVHLTCETQDVRPEGEAAIRRLLSPHLQGAAALVVLVGNDTHDRPWIDYEVAHVQSARKPVIAVRLPGTTGAPPQSLRRQELVTFEPEALRKALGT